MRCEPDCAPDHRQGRDHGYRSEQKKEPLIHRRRPSDANWYPARDGRIRDCAANSDAFTNCALISDFSQDYCHWRSKPKPVRMWRRSLAKRALSIAPYRFYCSIGKWLGPVGTDVLLRRSGKFLPNHTGCSAEVTSLCGFRPPQPNFPSKIKALLVEQPARRAIDSLDRLLIRLASSGS